VNPTTLTFQSHGVTASVQVHAVTPLDRVYRCLTPGWEPAPDAIPDLTYSLKSNDYGRRSGGRYILYRRCHKLIQTAELDEALQTLESDLHFHIAQRARGYLFVHAGVVVWRGCAIVLPGHTFSGKSTLTWALLQAGAAYYSDEYAVIDPRGYVHAFARPLALRRQDNGGVIRVQPELLGSFAGVEPAPVKLIAFCTYQHGFEWRHWPLMPGQAMLQLMRYTVAVRQEPERTISTLRMTVTDAHSLKAVRAEASEAAFNLLKIAERLSLQRQLGVNQIFRGKSTFTAGTEPIP
jgi:hypothetical protein